MGTVLLLAPKGYYVERLNRMPETALEVLMAASWAHWKGLGYSDDNNAGQWRDYLRHEDRQAPRLNFVIAHRGQAVAMASVAELDFPAIPSYAPWLTNLYVLPEHRGKGLSGLLRAHRLAALRQLGFPCVHVLAAPGTEKLHMMAGFAPMNAVEGEGHKILVKKL
jgi:predicted N-acetyltransferase YhbS